MWDIGVHGEIQKVVVTSVVMRHFCFLSGAPRACADFCDPTAVSRLNFDSPKEATRTPSLHTLLQPFPQPMHYGQGEGLNQVQEKRTILLKRLWLRGKEEMADNGEGTQATWGRYQPKNGSWAQKRPVRYWCASWNRKSRGHLCGDETFFCFARCAKSLRGLLWSTVVSRFNQPPSINTHK